MIPVKPPLRDAIIFYAMFAVACLALLLAPVPITIGVKLFILVILFHLALVITARARKHGLWMNIWAFTFFLSLFQVFPDWILSDLVKVLHFPDDGLFKIGSVSGYMAGLWTIPLFIIVLLGKIVEEEFSPTWAYFAAGVASLVIFGGSEQTMWVLGSWYPVNIKAMLSHTALYILIPEILLGISAYHVFNRVKDRHPAFIIAGAFAVMIFYTGNAAFFYFLVERIIL